jgi:hypothetical protein
MDNSQTTEEYPTGDAVNGSWDLSIASRQTVQGDPWSRSRSEMLKETGRGEEGVAWPPHNAPYKYNTKYLLN